MVTKSLYIPSVLCELHVLKKKIKITALSLVLLERK